jgi:endonuclease/exonuclease/phosphatase family metal-dependent hydrolase/membrane-associated phospholipid phosphatase
VIADRLLAGPARVAMAWALALALVVLVASAVLAERSDLYGWEEWLTDGIVEVPSAVGVVLRLVMQAGNRLAVAAVAMVFLIADRPRRAAISLLAGWGAWFAAIGLKRVIGRPRPSADVLGFSPAEFVSGSGYPSSHTTVAVALAVVVVTATDVPRGVKAVVVAAAALTGIARVQLAVHWSLDVIGGVALGVLVAGLVVVALDPAPVPSAWPGVGRWPPPTHPVPGPTASTDGPLRVATFNIRNGWALDWGHVWWLRRRSTAATIDALDADVAALQEVYPFQRRWLERAVPGRSWVGAGRTDGLGRGEQCPITWRPGILALEAWEVRWFSERPDQAGSRFPGARAPRIAVLARFRDRRSGWPFGVVNTHFDAHDRGLRVRSARMLLDWLATDDRPWIVLGDLNGELGGPTLDVLERGGYRSVDPDDERGTAHQFTGRIDGRRIDHVLVGSGWSVRSSAVPTHRPGRTLPSDHWPVVADVELLPP